MFKTLIGWLLFLCILPLSAQELPQKISLDLQNITIKEAIHLLAKFIQLNVVIDPTIQGRTSLHLHQVDAETALDAFIQSQHLSKWQKNHIWYIGSTALIQQLQKETLAESAFLIDNAPIVTRLWQIHYAKAEDIAHILQDNTHSFLSKRGHVSVDTRTNMLCIQDIEAEITLLQKLIQRLDVPVQQVLIEARLASIDNDFERTLGITFDTTQNGSTEAKPGQYSIAVLSLQDGSLLNMKLSALETTGHGELISSPSLFTASRKTASIEAGEEIPYQEISKSGATGVAFKKAVLSLKVTPEVMPHNQILLQLQINQDKPNNRVVLGVPSITTRQIMTNILIKNGQTIVLGGIYENNSDEEQQEIPFLGKIPLVGWLFKQQNVTKSKRELLIFVTPKVVY